MINLIPPEGHRLIKREYLLRVGGTLCFLFGSVFLVLTVAQVPTYVLIGAQINAFAVEIEEQSNKDDSVKLLDKEIERAQEVITQLKSGTSTTPFTVAVDEIQTLADTTIAFKAFVISEPDKRGEVKIRAQGTAPTREALAKLKSDIEASPLFEKAEVPISDLARDVDLPFVITITISEKV